jgi:RNA polymerase sigma factor (sigma-70 family)
VKNLQICRVIREISPLLPVFSCIDRMFPFQPKPNDRPTFEDMFPEHYSQLLEWALQLTRGDRFEAEDLVQELYIRFARLGTAPEHVESVENYLFSVLRNLHYSRARSARANALDELSIVDYDSAEWGLRATDRSGLLFIRADLHKICDYLCERKDSSRSASIFILRYFLGYFPNEVAKVVLSSRGTVDQAVLIVRREARLDLKRPGALRSMAAAREARDSTSAGHDDPYSLFLSLREKVFKSCPGECPGHSLLETRYKQAGQSFSTEELAHLVSCVACLDHANQLLGLPLLVERSPDDTIGRDTPQGPGSSGGATPTLLPRNPNRKKDEVEKRRKRLQRRAQEVDQHRPQRLLIAVDGEIRASQRVSSPLNEQQVELGRAERPSYIEILSEQGACLAFLLVHKPVLGSELYHAEEALLSDDRSLRVMVSFATEAPTIQVVYRDPHLETDDEAVETATDEPATGWFRNPVGLRILTNPGKRASGADTTRFWRRILPSISLTMNPLFASAVLLGISSLLCFLLWTRSGPRVSAGMLLSRAEQADAAVLTTDHPGVIYQKVRISEPGRSVERAIYRDPKGKRKPKQQLLPRDVQRIKDQLDLAGINWDDPLSATNYKDWHDRQSGRKDVVSKTAKDLLTLTTSSEANSPILQESLTVRESDFHPVERTIELRDAGTIEIAELNYDVMPWGAVNQDWFEPLAGGAAPARPSLHAAARPVLSELALDEAELGARVVLNQLQADTAEQIHVSRLPNGVQVQGVVDTEERKQQIVSRLLQVPHVHPSLLTVAELSSQPAAGSVPTGAPVEAHSVEAQPSPLEQYLREKQLPVQDLASLSHSLLDGSLKMRQAEVDFAELQPHFQAADHLTPDLTSKLAALSLDYFHTIETGLDANQRVLISLGLVNPNQGPAEAGSSREDLEQQVRQYQALCQELIADGTGRPATAIASELMNASRRIRLHITELSSSMPKAHN